MYPTQDHSLYGFYKPFFDTRTGQIFILCAPKAHIRDGLSAILIARLFGCPSFKGITIEPSRPTIQPAANIVLVGRASLFIDRDLEAVRGKKPLAVGYAKLGQRLDEISRMSCYRFSGSGNRALVNRLAGTKFAAEDRDRFGKEVDYGVIRRVFRCAGENTIQVEGIHGLGTLGAAKVATTPADLEEVWEAVSKIEDYDPSLPLEILVRTSFDSSLSKEVYSLDAIEARLVNIVYNCKWVYDPQVRTWEDQEPYDLVLEATAEAGRFTRLEKPPAIDGPWLELEADLRRLDPETRKQCLNLFDKSTNGNGRLQLTADRIRSREFLLRSLTASSDLFRTRLHEEASWGAKKVRILPTNPSEIRLLRKKFLVHLAFGHFLGIPLACRDREIRRYFPELSRRRSSNGRGLVGQITSNLNGRMREGFLPLLGEREAPKDYLKIHFDRKEKNYRLLLQRARLVIKLRV